MRKQNKLSSKDAGFTLLEVIVALAITAVGLVSALTLIQMTIMVGSISKNKLVAVYLAQEGIELVRNIRDTNWIEGDDWDKKIKGNGNEISGRIDYDDGSDKLGKYYWGGSLPADAQNCGAGEECRLYLNIANGFYSHNSANEKTPFYRVIFLDGSTINPGLEVTSQVMWTERGRIHEINLVDHLYEWQE